MKEQHSALTRSTQAASQSATARGLLGESSVGQPKRILWIDGVGGYLLIDKEEVVIGQANSSSAADIRIVGDVSRQAAAIRRSAGDYLLQPLQPTMVNGVAIDRPLLLNDQDEIRLGERVRVKFAKPNPLSGTASLSMESLHRFKPHVDGVLLMSDSCIIGPNTGSHVMCPTWTSELLLFRHSNDWFFRSLEEVEVDGVPLKGQIPMVAGMRMRGEDFSLSIE
ncbi:MAG: FHA domain-containing protein [bacterium]|nr:FHA domain-containing protein [bacterium]